MNGRDVGELLPPDRVLMGPGPSDVHPRVLRAMNSAVVSHLDPYFLEVMDDVQSLLRDVFRTDNEWTIPVSGTGSASMEAAVGNLVEPGDTVLCPDNGYFGERMQAMARRAGGEVATVGAPWGEPLAVEDVEDAINAHDPDVVGVVHAETSTGALQPDVPAIADAAHAADALVVLDCVTSLGGVPVEVDDWGIDAAYAAAQKCLSCPPGASPLTLSERAREKVLARDEPARSWYLDLVPLDDYWGDDRSYHHTAPVSNIYGLREALRLVEEEGLEARWQRHRRVAGAIKAGVEAMGLGLNPEDEYWLPTLNAVTAPDGVDTAAVRERLLEDHGIEVAGGLGALAGDVFRVGCMGHSARPANVLSLIDALGTELDAAGADVDPDAGLVTASDAL